MTISTLTRTKQYNGNNSTTVFAYDFNIQADSELEVYLGTPVGAPTSWAQQTLTTNFTVSSAGTPGGGNVTFGVAPPTGVGNVFIRRVTAKTQASDYVENDPFTAATLENNLDKLTQIQQDMQEEIDRCFKLGSVVPDAGETEASSVVADRKNKLFAFDDDGDFSVTSEIGTVKGNWAASTAYVLRDIVKDTDNNNIYICITAHTSSGSVPISTNTDAAKWSLLVDAASASTSATAAAGSATTATAQAVIATAKAVLTASDATDTAADLVETAADVVLTAADVVSAEAAKVLAEAATGALAFKFTFDNSTTMADPGTGELRLNNGTVGSVTAIAFDAVSADTSNPDVSDYIASWDDGTNSAHEGYITIRKSGTPATYAVFSLTGAVTDSTGWLQAVVTHVDSNGSWTNGDTMYVSFARSGNLGATGATGGVGVEMPDNTFRIQDNSDATKEIAFEASGISSGTTRTITMPDSNVTLGTPNSNTVDSVHYVDGSIDNEHIADDAIDSEHYATGSIDTAHIATNQIDETLMKDAFVADFTEVTVATGDSILLGDATDSGNTKRDTVQGVIDLVHGATAGVQTIWVPAVAMYPTSTNGCADLAQVEITAQKPEVKSLDFDASSDEYAQFAVCFPKSWDEGVIQFRTYWTCTGTNTGTGCFQLAGVAVSSDDPFGATFGTQVANTALAASGTANDLMVNVTSGDVTVGGSPAVGDQVFFQINRDISADTQTADIRLVGVKLFFTTDAENDA